RSAARAGRRRRLADPQREAVDGAAVRRRVVVDGQRPVTSGRLPVEPVQAIGGLRLEYGAVDDVELADGDTGGLVERDVDGRERGGADVREEIDGVTARRGQLDIEVRRVGVRDPYRDREVGHDRVTRDVDDGGHRAGAGGDGLGDVRAGVRGADRADLVARVHGGAEAVVAGGG